MHPCGTMALRSESRLRRSGAGTAWDKRSALFHSFPPSAHFPLMSFWLICLLLTLPSSVHRARSAPPLFFCFACPFLSLQAVMFHLINSFPTLASFNHERCLSKDCAQLIRQHFPFIFSNIIVNLLQIILISINWLKLMWQVMWFFSASWVFPVRRPWIQHWFKYIVCLWGLSIAHNTLRQENASPTRPLVRKLLSGIAPSQSQLKYSCL